MNRLRTILTTAGVLLTALATPVALAGPAQADYADCYKYMREYQRSHWKWELVDMACDVGDRGSELKCRDLMSRGNVWPWDYAVKGCALATR